MGDPFRDEESAALMRAARLEEENARLRRELEEARKPPPPPSPSQPKLSGRLVPAIATIAAIGLATAFGVATRSRPMPVPPPPLTLPTIVAPLPVPMPEPVREWSDVPKVTNADLRAYAQGTLPKVGYAVGKGGVILRHYADSASSTWTAEASGTDHDLFGVDVILSTACAVGAGGVATCTTDPEKPAWKVEKTGTANDLLAIAEDRGLVAVGRSGTIVRRSAGTWRSEPSGTTSDLYATDKGWAVGAGGTILHFDHEAHRWKSETSGTTEDLYGVATKLDAVVVVGAHGTILRRDDPRAGFRPERWEANVDLYAVTEGSGYSFYASGAGGAILQSSTAGAWRRTVTGTSHDLRAVVGSLPQMFAIGDDGTILSHRW